MRLRFNNSANDVDMFSNYQIARLFTLTGLMIVIQLTLPGHKICADEPDFIGAKFDESTSIEYPASPFVIDVTKPPYNAVGDGATDDTDAIQRALTDNMGLRRLIYFPNGTYLVSRTLKWSKRNSAGGEAWGMTFLQGQNALKTTIRLKNGTFPERQKPGAIMWCGGFGSADWFHNYVQDLTFDTGQNNSGAIGLQFYSNNSGAVRNCRFLASPGSGLNGLDLAHRDMNGPLLVRNCEVIGFERGIVTANAVNSQTFEQITLLGQSDAGFSNEGQSISIHRLVSDNSVPAVKTYGSLCLVDAQLNGEDAAQNFPAIINYNYGRIYLRDIQTSGYRRALGDVETPDSGAAMRIVGADKLGSEGPNIDEYSSQAPTSLFRAAAKSLRLEIRETPPAIHDAPQTWANVDDFGADPTGNLDSSVAIQKAIDSGATTVFLPGCYALKSTVIVRGKTRRLVGVGGWIDYTSQAKPDFQIVDGESASVTFEHFASIHGGISIDSRRTVVFRSVSDCDLTCTRNAQGGQLFFEDFVTHDLTLNQQQVWARQLNIENEGTHVLNDNSQLWILGYKTERGGTLVETGSNGRTEVLGGFSYTTTAGKLAPMFVTHDASVFAFFSEVCFNGDPFETLIRETQMGQTRTVRRGEGGTTPYIAVPAAP